METKVIQELIIEADKADSLGAVKKSLKEIKGAMIAIGDEGSEDFKKLSKAAAELKDKVEDANEAIERANPDKFTGLASAAKVAATGIQLTTGAMALFGDESEDVQKALLKVQAAMMFAQGLQQVKELSKDWNTMTSAIKANVLVQKLVTAAQWLWNAALAANPLVIALGAVVALGAAVYALSQAFSSERSETEKLSAALDELTKSRERNIEQIDQTLKLQKALGLSGEAELKASLAATQEKIKLLDKESEIYRQLKDKTDEQIEADKERSKELNRLLNEEQITYASLAKFRNDLEEKAAADQKKIQDDQIKEDQAAADRLKEQQIANYKKRQDELKALRIQYHRENTDADFLALEDFAATQKKYLDAGIITQDEYDEKLKQKKEALFGKFEAIERKGAETTLVVQEYAAEKQAQVLTKAQKFRQKLESENAQNALNNTANLFGSLAELSKKNAKAQKGFAIGQATINTFQGVTKALAAYPPPFSFLAAAAALAAGLVQVKNIIGTKEDGGGGSGGGGVSAPNLDAINTAPQGVQPSNQLDENGNVLPQNNQNQQPIVAYMVESQAAAVHSNVQMVEQAMRFQ